MVLFVVLVWGSSAFVDAGRMADLGTTLCLDNGDDYGKIQ
jgi:hypothetical protein